MKKIVSLFLFLFFIIASDAQVINFPDIRFKNYLLSGINTYDVNYNQIQIDQNGNGEIEVNEALLIYRMQPQCVVDCDNGGTINSLVGIEFFTNLRYLQISYSNIYSIDLTSLTSLEQLICSGNNISHINIAGLNNLNLLDCSQNNLTSIDFLNVNPLIQTISAQNNQLTSVNLNGLQNLEQIYIGYNNISSLTIANCPQLFSLWCNNNQISELEVNHLTELITLYCQDNLLTSIDVTHLTNLDNFFFSGNNLLTQIFMKNGSYQLIDYSIGLNNLNYVCADESEINQVQTIFNSNNYINYTVNSYCSFIPGGEYFVIQGNAILDNDSNGCNGSDALLPNLRINIADGENNGNFIANVTGQYSIPVQQGEHTLTPFIENPDYFNISPSSFQVSFPTQTSPVIQNFCITPNGIHQDLEVIIIPLLVARPGFDATYEIVYKNKGNMSQSGTVTLSFEDDLMDLVSSNPVFASQSFGLLSWDFNDLLPFETRSIDVKMNVNSPMEIPAVNIGDQLDFTATINPMTGDEYLSDNESSLKQIVVGSYDPNDKTCIEGSIVGPGMIGQYVHYVIRFENTGTFPAENVVVKDMIDLTKFDINTLIPINSSHSFVARINGNKVEFIFENIQLPFEDAINDGYIAFKIKTKPTLVLGDTFTNNASIYFDYNFPIVTNTASTVIQALGNQDLEFSNYFNLYPIPANDVLIIKAKRDIELKSISVYNILGQLVLALPNVQQVDTINVSNLNTGSYFIKLETDKGITSSKFVKK
ncbi:T9SS type A sorting domain-containing protein [Flavobacterium sp. 102]|uniref:DUF7619 domain-containing protein n=1 Tax=Flavobacterium sp. 102 TaxID=2135623 RepID=UPI000EAB5269|nr:T9SS type A sorting domain-containing protein [Flavobacterium sp. 102]RKS03315.1 putative repeat protein (TIGR01451 family)/predicted secreted protein (Por secretion system target) [Flavobacterium sp. 102]